MQLKKIKLAGFKSFVDPTTVLVPTNLVAIVGPNGCGKSNIIDAVCWVMGENSAKYLRGESLADVIFNGSTARKPVGQASVELVFDNQDGSLGGEYASYAEISIRRQITRDSESAYFLNGVRCRRRDIVDIFLGTGLGPRSYSIIGQNMISRIIEAKPDEMRVYLEEAAGVSRYKERRRETENRIQHTKENLARLNDVRTELDKQLSALKRQANAAEKYKILKQEERIVRAEWLTIQWRELDTKLVGDTLQIQQQATGLEARQAELTELNLQHEYKREALREANDVFQEVQQRYYAIGNEITRLEQDVAHTEERQKERQKAIQDVELETQEISDQLNETNEKLEELSQDAERLEPESKEATEIAEQLKDELAEAEEAMQSWQTQWDTFNQLASRTTQIAEVEQTRIQHLEQKIIASKQRQTKLEEEKSLIDFSKLESSIDELDGEVKKAADEKENYTQQLAEVQEQFAKTRTLQQKTSETLNQVQGELQVLQGKEASLQALQETALGRRNDTLTKWLKTNALDKKPRLAEEVKVAAGWEQAVEKVLGAYLQAICVDDMQQVLDVTEKLKEGSLFVVAPSTLATKAEENTLLSKVESDWPLSSLLAGIYVASSVDEASELAKKLKPHESVITQDGVWLGNGWLRISRDENPEAGVFQREEELRVLTKKIKDLREKHEESSENLEQYREQLKDLESQRESLQKTVNQSNIKAAQIQTEQKITRERLTELKDRLDRFEKEYAESKAQQKTAEEELKSSREKWQQAMDDLEEQSEKRESLAEARDDLRHQLQMIRNNANQAKDKAHQLEIRLQTTLSELSSLKQMSVRLQTQLTSLEERHTTLQAELEAASSLETLQNNLEAALKKRLTLEEEVQQARTNEDVIKQEIKQVETHRQEVEREMTKLREKLESLRIESQGLKVKSETLLEQIKEIGFHIEDVLKQLPEITGLEEWHERLQQITLRISRLGAINLVAIEEYTACAERKEYLDKQNADLEEGLATLESAIAKIDKETRARFKETFDKVNEHFQTLFPKVFAGGKSYLELTGDNLLDAGVTVMACPPGKRNSTIHLLSGGEKALTAIALVFSIFQLNPAPFCILDEVDAPLDDANVGRFCQLVKDMSEKTQFIFISHNKLAIEMANTLIGVTMHEPGVSRLVSVDVQEAMSLAGV